MPRRDSLSECLVVYVLASGLESLIHSQSQVRQQTCIYPLDSTWIKNHLLKLKSGICQYAVFQHLKIASSWLVVLPRMYKVHNDPVKIAPTRFSTQNRKFCRNQYRSWEVSLPEHYTICSWASSDSSLNPQYIKWTTRTVRLADLSWSPTMFKDFDQGPQALMESLCASWSFLFLLWYCKSDTSKPHAHRLHQTTDLAHASRPVKQPQIPAILILMLTDAGRIIFGM